MDEELERGLVDAYPDIFALYDASPDDIEGPPPSFTLYGFQCGDGWYDLIDGLCETIQRRNVSLQVVQVKEKFGGLRFYHDGVQGDEDYEMYMVAGAIQQAQTTSRRICEDCGHPGELRQDGGWLRTRCEECYDEVGASQEEEEDDGDYENDC